MEVGLQPVVGCKGRHNQQEHRRASDCMANRSKMQLDVMLSR